MRFGSLQRDRDGHLAHALKGPPQDTNGRSQLLEDKFGMLIDANVAHLL